MVITINNNIHPFIQSFTYLLSSLHKPDSALSDENTETSKAKFLSSRNSQSCGEGGHVKEVTAQCDTCRYTVLQIILWELRTQCVCIVDIGQGRKRNFQKKI